MRFDDIPREVLAAAIAVVSVYAVVTVVGRWARRARMRRRFVRAAEGESEAARLLEARGFVIEGSQVTGAYALNVDAHPVEIRIRADYIVSLGGDRYVAEVKTGRLAPKIETATTRRQLLEYAHAFDVVGVLLVDADARTVRHVEFSDAQRSPRSSSAWAAWVLAAIAALVLVILRGP